MAEAVAVVRLRKKAEREKSEADGLESSSLTIPRSRTLLQKKFTQYEEENRRAWHRSQSESAVMGSSQSLSSPPGQTTAPHSDDSEAMMLLVPSTSDQGVIVPQGEKRADAGDAGNGGNGCIPPSRSDQLPRKKQVTFSISPESMRASRSAGHGVDPLDPFAPAHDDNDNSGTLVHSHNRLWDITMTPDATPAQQGMERAESTESEFFSCAQMMEGKGPGRGIESSASAATTSSMHSVGHAEGSFLSFFHQAHTGMAEGGDGSAGGGVGGGDAFVVGGSSGGGGGGNHQGVELTALPSSSLPYARSNRSNGLTESSLSRRTAVAVDVAVAAGAAAAATEIAESSSRDATTHARLPVNTNLQRSVTRDDSLSGSFASVRGTEGGLSSRLDDLSEEEEGEEGKVEELHDDEVDSMDKEVVQDIFNRVCAMEEKVGHYIDLCGFLLLLAIFCTILCLQADPTACRQVLAAHEVLLPPGLTLGSAYSFDSKDDFYSWLNASVLQTIGAGPPCGDGSCDPPFEFPSFGRFGCKADCGAFTNVTIVLIAFSTNFNSPADMDESSWNLCMDYPMALCWYEEAQPFTQQSSEFTISVSIPDGNWSLILNAPHGGVSGSIATAKPGSLFRLQQATVGSADVSTLTSFGGCEADMDGNRTNCVATCERMVICMQTSCGRNVSIQEVSAAFVACKALCSRRGDTRISSILHLQHSSCDSIATFLNTSQSNYPCYVNGSTSSADPSAGDRGGARSETPLPTGSPPPPPLGKQRKAMRQLQQGGVWGEREQKRARLKEWGTEKRWQERATGSPSGTGRAASRWGETEVNRGRMDKVVGRVWNARALQIAGTKRQRVARLLSEEHQGSVHSSSSWSSSNSRQHPFTSTATEGESGASSSSSSSSSNVLEAAEKVRAMNKGLGHSSWRASVRQRYHSVAPALNEPLARAMAGEAAVGGRNENELEYEPAATNLGVLSDASTAATGFERTADAVESMMGGIGGMAAASGYARVANEHPPSLFVYPANASIWSFLGATDDQRIHTCQVAVARTVYTMVKDSCLAGTSAKGLSLSSRNRMVAFLCTLFGGPAASDPRCKFTDPSSGRQLVDPQEMFDSLRKAHRSRNISMAQQHRFIDMLVSAFKSVAATSAAASDAMMVLLQWFDGAVVNPSLPGCSQEGAWLQWKPGAQLNTTVTAGSRVTWVWASDDPMSLKVSGTSDASSFFGFGSNDLLVSRLMDCTPDNVGFDDAMGVPFPCVLKLSSDPSSSPFSFSKVFDQPGTVLYYMSARAYFSGDGDTASSQTGVVNVTAASPSPHDAVITSCSPGCSLPSLANGVCEAACNVPDCNFDGGDCTCFDADLGSGLCPCGGGNLRTVDGSCCVSAAVGSGLSFPFSLLSHGSDPEVTNAAFLLAQNDPQPKWVGHNKVMIGVILGQARLTVSSCNCSRLSQLTGWCSQPQPEVQPFGVNPHFLPSSSLYNPTLIANTTALDNTSYGMRLLFNPQNLPYGFIPPVATFDLYPIVFDINLDYTNTMNRLQYLVDGHYIDNATDSITLKIITFNAQVQKLVVLSVTVDVNEGGNMDVTYSSSTVPMQLYAGDTASVAVLVLQVLFLIGILWNIFEEAREMRHCRRVTGTALSYFENRWNWVDLASLALQLTGIAMWIVLCYEVSHFTMEPRYDLYFSLGELPRYWAVPNPPTAFMEATRVFRNVLYLSHLYSVYFTIQGLNLFLMLVRALKLMDFQPYLGIVTRSLNMAALSLIHFFILAFLVFFCFSIFAYAVFGASVPQFSTLTQSMLTCFMVLINDNDVFYSIMYLDGWSHVAALIFWFLYIILMVFILFNFLIAIIVDAFMDVQDVSGNQTTLFQDLWDMWQYARWRMRGKFRSTYELEKHLICLGAADMRFNQMNVLDRYRSIGRRLHNIVVPVFKGQVMSGRHEPRIRRQQKQRVLTVKDNRIDETSLAVILARRAKKARAVNLNKTRTGGYRSVGTVVADRIGSSMKSMMHAFSSTHPCEVACVPSRGGKAGVPDPLSEVDTDVLTEQVIAQFGEEVVRREVPIVPQARKKRDAEILKEDMKKALAEVQGSRHASEELKCVLLRVEQEQSVQRIQLQRVIETMQVLAEQVGRLHEMQAAAAAASASAGAAAAVANRNGPPADSGLKEDGSSGDGSGESTGDYAAADSGDG